VKDATSVRNIPGILKKFSDDIIIVVSAMGKSTNALEKVVYDYFTGTGEALNSLQKVKNYHLPVVEELFPDLHHPIHPQIAAIFTSLDMKLLIPPGNSYDFEYDQIVSAGEILSTLIVAEYLNAAGIRTKWKDIRDVLKTDSTFREGKINWELSEMKVKESFSFTDSRIYLTQGFIASTIDNQTTTLGREGSDYTAAILAFILEAEKVMIWKDVPGVLNADPKFFDDAVLLKEISYRDAIELAYYGAKVIHPKTIQPLQRKNISLYVKSFVNPVAEGTKVGNVLYDKLIPSFIIKTDQALIHFYPNDLSFIAEENLEVIIGCFARNGVDINMMQNSAVSFQVCVNRDVLKINKIMEELRGHFDIDIEYGLELATVRYYDESTIKRVTEGKERLLEQRNKTTAQVVMRKKDNSNKVTGDMIN